MDIPGAKINHRAAELNVGLVDQLANRTLSNIQDAILECAR